MINNRERSERDRKKEGNKVRAVVKFLIVLALLSPFLIGLRKFIEKNRKQELQESEESYGSGPETEESVVSINEQRAEAAPQVSKGVEIVITETGPSMVKKHIEHLNKLKNKEDATGESKTERLVIKGSAPAGSNRAVEPKEIIRIIASSAGLEFSDVQIEKVRCQKDLEQEILENMGEMLLPVEEEASEETSEPESEGKIVFCNMARLTLASVSESFIDYLFRAGEFPALKSLHITGCVLENTDVLNSLEAENLESLVIANITGMKTLDVGTLKSFGALKSLGLSEMHNSPALKTDLEELACLLETLDGEIAVDWNILADMAERFCAAETKRAAEEGTEFCPIHISARLSTTGLHMENYTEEKKSKVAKAFKI